MIVKAAIGFLSYDSDAVLVNKTQAVLSNVTGNPNFSTPSPSLETIQTALTAFIVALSEAANRGREEVAIKNAKRAELVSLMRQLASYITVASNGDMAKLLSSEFPHIKPTRSPIGALPTPAAPAIRLGVQSGQLSATVLPVYGAQSYNWRVALSSAPQTYVQTAQTTGGRKLFTGLTPGQTYSVQVSAVGAAGPSDWSDDAELMVI